MNNPNNLGIIPSDVPWQADERQDIENFVKDCYDNDIVWDAEPGAFIKYESLIDKFTFFWEGKQKYFDDYETAEDWLLLNQARIKNQRDQQLNVIDKDGK